LHRLASAFVLGYHGCDQTVADDVLAGLVMKPSSNDYDWLGEGIYFWEANPRRGLEWAKERSASGKSSITTPAVVGAVIDLGLCLDLTTSDAIEWVKAAHSALEKIYTAAGNPMPKNSKDGLRRNLDCAVLNVLHEIRQDTAKEPIQTVRGVFIEGKPIYSNSDFFEKTHIQIAVRDAECIKGIFRVPESHLA